MHRPLLSRVSPRIHNGEVEPDSFRGRWEFDFLRRRRRPNFAAPISSPPSVSAFVSASFLSPGPALAWPGLPAHVDPRIDKLSGEERKRTDDGSNETRDNGSCDGRTRCIENVAKSSYRVGEGSGTDGMGLRDGDYFY